MAEELAKQLEQTKVEDGAPEGEKKEQVNSTRERTLLSLLSTCGCFSPVGRVVATTNVESGVPLSRGARSCGEAASLIPSDANERVCRTQIVTPWEVAAEGGINYDKLLSQFGCQKINPDLVAR